MFGRRKSPSPAPAEAPVLTASRSMPPTPAAEAAQQQRPAQPGRGPHIATKLSELPQYTAVLSLAGGELHGILTDAERDEVVLTDMPSDSSGKVCQVLCTAGFVSAAHGYADLQRRLKTRGWTTHPPVRVSKELLITLFDQESEGDELNNTESEMTKHLAGLLASTVNEHGSDIHIEIRGAVCNVYFRINKRIVTHKQMKGGHGLTMLRAAYQSMALNDSRSATTWSDKEGQNCALERTVHGSLFRFRYQHAPVSPNGLDCVMRALPIGVRGEAKPFEGFQSLGYTNGQAELISEAFADPKGAVIIAGKMGSGKSTALKYGLEYLHELRPYFKIRTIEDPVEYYIRGASQHPVIRRSSSDGDSKDGESDFAKTYRDILRMDADAIMLGEIRDEVTARLMVRSSQSGQKSAATVHASSGFGIVRRLEELEVSPTAMADEKFLSALIFQELMPVVCPHCSLTAVDLVRRSRDKANLSFEQRRRVELREPTLRRVLTQLKDFASVIRFEGDGCDQCNNRRTTGMTVCAEVIQPDDHIRRSIASGDLLSAIRHWEGLLGNADLGNDAHGWRCIDHGLSKMLSGVVSAEAFEDTYGFMTRRQLGRSLDLLRDMPLLFVKQGALAA